MVKYIENYALYEEIGSGVYGKVYRAINSKDQKEYAIKVIPITKFRQNKKLQQCTVNEINILTSIEVNKHIIKYFDMLKTSNNFYFIYQYCNGGTLDQVITKEGKLSEKKALSIFGELLQAFKILNKYNILHRDLKPDNIFFHDNVIKLGDFGFCKNLESADQMTKTMLGSPIYMAPQVIRGQVYSNKADIWSLGVVLYEMLFGHCPFMSNSIAKLIEVLNTQKLIFPQQVSPFVKNLLERMLTKDPVQRIGWLQLFMLKINSDGGLSKMQNKKIASLQDAIPSEESNNAPNSFSLPINSTSTSSKEINNSSNSVGTFKKDKKIKQASIIPFNEISNEQVIQIAQDHKKITEGMKLSLDLTNSKMPNCMGYGNLVITQTIKLLNDLTTNCAHTEIKTILSEQLKDLKSQQEALNKKMFSYELKGTDDWKKYLRGKFFEEESTIMLWYRMVTYLEGVAASSNSISNKGMADIIKKILY